MRQKKGFPRFFVSELWGEEIIFLRINNEYECGTFLCTFGWGKSLHLTFKQCLENIHLKEISAAQAALMI